MSDIISVVISLLQAIKRLADEDKIIGSLINIALDKLGKLNNQVNDAVTELNDLRDKKLCVSICAYNKVNAKIRSVKILREHTNMGLKETKELVEACIDRPGEYIQIRDFATWELPYGNPVVRMLPQEADKLAVALRLADLNAGWSTRITETY